MLYSLHHSDSGLLSKKGKNLMLKPGCLLDGKYRILKVIGRGGMSTVYLALNERANKHWAVKEIRKDGRISQDLVRESLIAETEILKNLRHPGLPRVIDVIDHQDAFLLVMDYVRGDTLDVILKNAGPLPEKEALNLAEQLLGVLSYLHTREPPVIYLDLKPDNIMVRPDGTVVLIDFGTARIMQGRDDEASICLGTKGYAAPEQYEGRGQTDARTDIYCLGATLFYLITGRELSGFYGNQNIQGEERSLSDGMEHVIAKCTRANPAERYQSCDEVISDLKHLEELDHFFRKSQIVRLKVFMCLCIITVFISICSVVTGVYYRHLVRQDYLGYLQQAFQAQKLIDMEKTVHKAVSIDREAPEAYQGMLSWITSDQLMTDSEKTAMETLLYEKTGGRQNITLFRKKKKYYSQFCYDMGLACFFYYKGSRGKNIAVWWFEESRRYPINEDKSARADIYARIGTYYSSLIHGRREGEEAEGDYRTFFNDLTALGRFSPEEIGNPGTALTLYNEIASQIGDHAADFLDLKDVTPGRLRKEILRLRKYVQSDMMKTVPSDNLDNVCRNIEEAELDIDAAIRRYAETINGSE